MRVGIDPVFGATMLIPKIDTKEFPLDYHNFEASFELIGPYRLSFFTEIGHTNLSVNVLRGTQVFTTKGVYGRIGFNFDVSKPDKNKEFDIGWRLGFSNPEEYASIYLKGVYWDNEALLPVPPRHNFYLWGEMLAEYKFRISHEKPFWKNVWFGSSIRIKFNPKSLQETPFKTQYVPGLGFGNSISPGFSFNLIYTIHFTTGIIHKAHHLDNNYDIIEDKDHHIKKIKKHKQGADEIDRD